ncbi:hypothetical protein [Paenibacillus sp. OV219]|uniref:BclA C-terminal domain-containing protein n=1 Tax=Paenibacillus sp. OV219 TaxID=1884377 RepID=UPI0008B3650D|nr:hypothetical protein [Paenibacillus sp. OV219]SEM82380.1 hypothetical protein SAMN05518847_101896 [Paenibacillus sp. OV219]
MAIILPIGPPIVSGFIFNVSAQTVPVEADVTFDTNGILTPGITHVLGSSQIGVTNPGNYEITFFISGVEPNQFALFKNGTQVTGTVYGSGAGTQQNNGQAIITLAAGDVLTLRNHSSAAAVTLQTLAGGTQTNVNTSVIIKKLS